MGLRGPSRETQFSYFRDKKIHIKASNKLNPSRNLVRGQAGVGVF